METKYSDSYSKITINQARSKVYFGRDGFPNSQQTDEKSRIPCPNFGDSRFTGSSQIPDPVKILNVFPIPAPYFAQIPDPENTLPDPDKGS